ncbi:MAG: hypothetical protein KC466_01815 [Myxococcales bacterium]|nr:hypothetical protein [Myxococcales bacterium]
MLSFVVGAVACLTARGEVIEARSPVANRPFVRALAFQCLVFVPIGIHLAVLYPGWSWMYFVDTDTLAPVWTALAVFGYVVSMVVGFLFADRAVRQGRVLDVQLAVAVTMVAAAVLTVTQLDRLTAVGTHAAFRAGTATPVWQDLPFLASLLLWGPYFALGFAVLIAANLGWIERPGARF